MRLAASPTVYRSCVALFVLSVSVPACSVQVAPPSNRSEESGLGALATATITKAEYYDKTLAGILGHVGGFLSGYEFVTEDTLPDAWFRLTYGPYSGDSPYWSNTTYPGYDRLFANGRVGGDDEYHVDFFNQHVLEVHGPDASFQDIKDEWVDHQVSDFGGGLEAMRLMNEGMLPPLTGKAEFNKWYWVSEPYIETETLGLTAPGMPHTARALAEKFGSVTGEFEGVVWAKFFATMYALAYFETDARVVMDKAAVTLPRTSWPYQIYLRVRELYRQNPNDWRWAQAELKKVRRQVYKQDNVQVLGDINNGSVMIGLLYGNNDYLQTAKIMSLIGNDADTTAAAALGLMGILKGMSGTPQEIKDRVYAGGNGVYVNDLSTGFDTRINRNYPAEQRWTDLARLYQRNAERVIVAQGGSVGSDSYQVSRQEVTAESVLEIENYDFERGSLAGWTASSPPNALAENNGTAQSGNWKGTVFTNASVGEARLYVTLAGLESGATYRARGFIATNGVARFYAEGYGGPYVAATTVNSAADPLREYHERSVEFTASGSGVTVGLHLPPGPAAWAAIDNLQVERITSPVRTRYEAETASRSGGTVRSSPSASGGSYLGGLDNVGNYMQFNVNAPSAGEHRLAINYANGWSASSKLNLYVNGVWRATVTLPRTGAWGSFSRNLVPVPVELNAGSNTIRLQKDGETGYAELDYAELSRYPTGVYVAATPLPTLGSSGPNLTVNPGFEAGGPTQTPSGWTTWPGSSGAHADADYTESGARSGAYRATHQKASAYEVYTSQTITGLSSGLYTLQAWVVGSGGQNAAHMDVKGHGGSPFQKSVPMSGWPNWTRVEITGVPVTSGQATIGFYSNANAGNWLSFDDVAFYKQ